MRTIKTLFCSDVKSLSVAMEHTIPDVILIHGSDLQDVYPLLKEKLPSNEDVSVIVISDENLLNYDDFSIYQLPESFTESDLCQLFSKNNNPGISEVDRDKIINSVMNHLPVAVFWKNANLEYLGCNQLFCRDSGVESPNDIIGHTVDDIFPEQIAKTNNEIDLKVIRTGIPVLNYEGKIRNADGSVDFVQISKIPIKNSSGEVVALIGLYERITEQVLLQKHLRNEQHYLQMLMDNIPDTIYFKDKNSKFVRINKAQAKLLGVDNPENAIGKSDSDFFESDHAKQAFEDEQALMKKGEPLINKLEYIKTSEGYKYVTATKIPLKDEDGVSTGLVGLSRDVTKEHLTELQLKHEKELLDLVINNIPDKIYFKDTESRYIRANIAYCKSLGIDDPNEIAGKMDSDFYPKEIAEKICLTEKKILIRNAPVINQIEKEKKEDGSLVWNTTCKIPIKDEWNEVIGLVCISRDVTSEELARQRMQHAKEKAEEASKAKSLFLANMSHEIRTPMNGVIGMADILRRTKLDSTQLGYLNIIMKSGQSLLGIINDILDFSKIESGKMEFEYAPISIRHIVEEIADIQIIQANEQSIDLLTYVDPSVPELVNGDYVRIKQILSNLVNNAIKFTEQGEVYIVAEVVQSDNKEHRVRFAVKDTGIGISKEHQKKLFQSFTQVDTSTTRKFGGTGLGLAISKKLVDGMGGNLSLTSEEGKGSEFYFTLKLTESDDKLKNRIQFKNVSFDGLKAIIVDDNKTNRTVFKEYLKSWGMITYEATDGYEALDKLKKLGEDKLSVDLALIDYQMPKMNGVKLARKIKEDFASDPIRLILFSSVTDAIQDNKQAKSDFDNYLNKPIKLKQLYNVIASVVGQQKYNENEEDRFLSVKGSLREKHILIVEDNKVSMQVAYHSIKPHCSNIYKAYDGREALEIFKKEKIDYILMDIQMPEMNGIEATKEIREIESKRNETSPVKIIAMTANTLREDVEECLKVGMDSFLGKPFKVDDLIRVLID